MVALQWAQCGGEIREDGVSGACGGFWCVELELAPCRRQRVCVGAWLTWNNGMRSRAFANNANPATTILRILSRRES